MGNPDLAFQVIIEVITLLFMLVGLFGLLIPIFPGLTVMWLGPLLYVIVQNANGNMNWLGWLLFGLITLLMLGGNVVDNIIIARHVREKQAPWSSIVIAFIAGLVASIFFTPLIGIIASPVGLFLAEWRRLRDQSQAFAITKAWMTGWGWSIAARFGIGLVMIALWLAWAWAGHI